MSKWFPCDDKSCDRDYHRNPRLDVSIVLNNSENSVNEVNVEELQEIIRNTRSGGIQLARRRS